MVAAHGNVKALRIWIEATFDLADAAPVDVGRISILLVAGHHAALATDALRHVEMKAVLFPWLECPLRNAWHRRRGCDLIELLFRERRGTHHESKAIFPRTLNEWQRTHIPPAVPETRIPTLK